MTEDITETTSQRKTGARTNLLFHGTKRYRVDEIILEHGLLANKSTLTPRLELALKFTDNMGLLTCWYPKKREVQPISVNSTMPTIPVDEQQRADLAEFIKSSDLDDRFKKAYLEEVKRAETFLPGSRLGAIIETHEGIGSALNMQDYDQNIDFLDKFANHYDETVQDMLNVLKMAKIRFFDPGLTVEALAEDMVKANFEHRLLNIGRDLKGAEESKGTPSYTSEAYKAELTEKLQGLEEVTFNEPVYERYRTMLITEINKFLQQ